MKTTETNQQLAKLLKQWRSDRQLTQHDAAKLLGINQRTLENWEQGRAAPIGYGLRQLLQYLNRQLEPKE